MIRGIVAVATSTATKVPLSVPVSARTALLVDFDAQPPATAARPADPSSEAHSQAEAFIASIPTNRACAVDPGAWTLPAIWLTDQATASAVSFAPFAVSLFVSSLIVSRIVDARRRARSRR